MAGKKYQGGRQVCHDRDIKSFIQDKFGTTDVEEIKSLSDEEKDKLEKENGIDSVDDEYYDIELDSEKSSNGNIPDGQLVNLLDPDGNQTKNKLNPLAAKDYNDMVKTAYDETDGKIEIKVSQGYRPLGSREEGCGKGFTQWCAWIKYKSGKGNRAAKPGTSNHGKGSAIDVKNCRRGSKVHTWLVDNASRFNFKPLSSEPWHWDHSSSN
jgi:LAS superfamily LD-carboxypeptidase LdcB